jgi:hypothetical protein
VKTVEYARAEDQLPDHATPPTGALDTKKLVAVWFATDKEATGLVRIELREHEGALLVRAFGADPAEPVDWGEVEATSYGTGVTARDAVAFSAVFDFGFLVTVLAGQIRQGILALDTFNSFTDSSGRSNYFSREFFHS